MSGSAGAPGEYDIDPYLMTVLSKKFEAVTRDMTQSLLRSARSGVISGARDFSSALTLFDGRQFMIEEGLPVHVANVQFIPEYTVEKFDDISPGDCFLTNSPYAGNSHHADYTLHAPVFFDGEPLFWAVNKAHQADVGTPEPLTYLASAENIYQEGQHYPSVRVQDDYEDCEDVVRMCKLNIRMGEEQWYGDYQAQVSAVRTGEEKLRELVTEYGVETVKRFVGAWLDYGERMMRTEIKSLPESEFSYTAYHDPVDGAPDGVPVTVEFSIDPDRGEIAVDLTDNMETLPNGFNLCEATTVAGVYSGIFNNVDSEIPHNQGSLRPIDIEMDEGRIVGKAEYPASTAVATTNVCGVLFNATQAAFGELGEPYGMAEGTSGVPPNCAVVSGTDFRRDGGQFVNQLVCSGGGGPALYGHDGWQTYLEPVVGGVMNRDSIEIDEQKYPILFERHELVTDSEGAGKWRGAPASRVAFRPREDSMTVAFVSNGRERPPQGILDGEEGAPQEAYKRGPDGEETELPNVAIEEIRPDETVVGAEAGGGGYGDPFERDVERVREDVEAGYISADHARETYGVVVETDGTDVVVDEERTADLRRGRQTTGGGR